MDAVYNVKYVLFISFISALGGYLFGFDFAVISSALPFLREQFGLDAYWEGFATACLAIGAIGGCVFAGRISERFGRRRGLLCAAVVFALSSLGMAFSPSLFSFI
ncbi:MAG TPA: MFS transporter, partial [Puia sp.]|nr:MFS transporter [Puia sp.]